MPFNTHLAVIVAGLLISDVAALWQETAGRLFSNSFGVPGVNTTYDYIVVGGGTAGNTIATRLAQNGTFSVAVVEAGSFYEISNGNGSVIPGLSITQYTGTSPTDRSALIDWNFVTTPQAVRCSVTQALVHCADDFRVPTTVVFIMLEVKH